MAEPKIRYDILANAEGQEDVARLTRELLKVDDALDPAAAARAKALADEIQQLAGKRQAVENFLTALGQADAASRSLEGAQEALQRLERRLEGVQAPTRAQAGQLEKLRDAAARAQTAFTENNAALNRSRTGVESLGISTTNLTGVQERLNASIRTTAGEAQTLVTHYRETATAATNSAAKQAAAQKQVGDGISSLGRKLGELQALAATAIGGTLLTQAAGDVARTADAYNNLAARIRLVTGEGQAFDQAFQGVFDIATRTNSSLESTGNLFTRIAQAGKAINLSQRDALALTETVNQAIQLSGATAQASDAAITQLVQALQSGVLRGEEFNSVMEQSPRLAQALAAGLGVTIGELRKLAEQGSLTSDVVIRALQGQAQALQAEFEKLPPTVGRAIQNLSTEWTRYIGQADQASGASATAAKAIGLVAENLGVLASTLISAGEAWLAFKALDLAALFFRQSAAIQAAAAANVRETATRVASTEATVANTVALAGNTAATAANSAAKAANATATAAAGAASATFADTTAAKAAGALSTVGRLAGAIGLAGGAVALFGDIAVRAFTSVGTFIGEGIAKLQGYRDRSAEVLALQKAQDAAAREQAASQAAFNQQLEQAADRALGLSVAAKKLVADFEALERKGESASAQIEKLVKNLDLTNIQGIADAGAALDALGLKGKLTGQQIREALGEALKTKDLAIFQAEAGAAFDGSTQGVRRLRAALDALNAEALRRVGTSVDELKTGFDKASASAINDVDALAKALDDLGVKSSQSSGLLATALDKATQAAGTERAVQAVIDRIVTLGKQGRIAGDDLSDALEKARKKLDELTPGIGTLNEALRAFGLKTRSELQATAERLGSAYRLLANDVSVSLADKVKAFEQYRDAAIAANAGVESGEVRLQRTILQNQVAVRGLGTAIVSAMGDAKKATDAAAEAQLVYQNLLRDDPSRLVGGDGGAGIKDPSLTGVRDIGSKADSVLGPSKIGPTGSVVDGGSFQVPVPPGFAYTLDPYAPGARPAGTAPNGMPYPGYLIPIGGQGLSPTGGGSDPTSGGLVRDPMAAVAAELARIGKAIATTVTGPPVSLNVTVGGKNYGIAAASMSDAERMVKALEDAYRAGGGR